MTVELRESGNRELTPPLQALDLFSGNLQKRGDFINQHHVRIHIVFSLLQREGCTHQTGLHR